MVCIHVVTRFGAKQELSPGLCMRTVADNCPSSTSSSIHLSNRAEREESLGKDASLLPQAGGDLPGTDRARGADRDTGWLWRGHSTHHAWSGTNPALREERRDKGKQ